MKVFKETFNFRIVGKNLYLALALCHEKYKDESRNKILSYIQQVFFGTRGVRERKGKTDRAHTFKTKGERNAGGVSKIL